MTTLDDNLWEKCRTKIRNEISEEIYNTWFQHINFDSITETKLFLSVPNTFYKDCLEQNYLDIINSSLNSFTQSSIQTYFRLENNSSNHPKQETPKLKNEKEEHSISFTACSTINPKYNFENFDSKAACIALP